MQPHGLHPPPLLHNIVSNWEYLGISGESEHEYNVPWLPGETSGLDLAAQDNPSGCEPRPA